MTRRLEGGIATSLAAHAMALAVATWWRSQSSVAEPNGADDVVDVEILSVVPPDTQTVWRSTMELPLKPDSKPAEPARHRVPTRTGRGQAAPHAEVSVPALSRGRDGSSGDGPPAAQPRALSIAPSMAARTVADPDTPPGPVDILRPTQPGKSRSELRPDGYRGYKVDESVFTARVGKDGQVRFEDRKNIQLGPQPTFDIGDAVMRAAGQDPYAARKLAFLDRTRDQRYAMAEADTLANLHEALRRTASDLDRIWRGPGPPAEKRRLLFGLWEECAETGQDAVVATARAVRAAIIAFIRRRLPRGSPDAYSDAELRSFNASRSSRERFDPY